MAPDNGGRPALRAPRRAVATTGAPRLWPVRLLVIACAALTAVGCTQRGPSTDQVALLTSTQGGDQPWTDRLLPAQTPTVVPPGPPGSELPATTGEVVTGDRGGLYGGSLDRPLCDSGRLVDELERDPAKLEAWSSTQGVSDVRGFVGTLTPVLLRADTRVTNYGYADGRATPREAVLESGTIVLIDEHGVPKVRCAYGSPLDTPSSDADPDPKAVPWPGFDAARVLVIRPAIDTMGAVSVVDLATGNLTAVPVGSGPEASPPATSQVTTSAPTPVVSAPVEQAPRRAQADAPSPEPPPQAPPPQPVQEAPAAPEPVVIPQPQPQPPLQPVAPPPEIRLEVPGLPPLVIPIPR